MVHVYISRIETIKTIFLENKLNRLGSADIAKAMRYHKTIDVQRFVAGRLLLSSALQDLKLDFNIKDLSFSKTGRPFLGTGVDFNVSHSGNVVVCALSACNRVGIDIELCQQIEYNDFTSCFSTSEWTTIQNGKLYTFYEYWTMKEAAVKADGRGLGIPLSEVTVRDSHHVAIGDKLWFLSRLYAGSEYVCHLATGGADPQIRTTEINYIDLFT